MIKKPLKSFQASDGKTYTGQQLLDACAVVGKFYKDNAWSIWHSDDYADHVTQERKDQDLNDQLEFAVKVARGDSDVCSGLSVAQRINVELCGECPAILP